MPLERSDAVLDLSDPNIILGPCKCRPTERVLENRDPLACKRVRKAQGPIAVMVSNARADKEDRILSLMLRPTHLPHTAPNPKQATNDAERGNDRTSNGPQAIVVEDSASDERSDEGEATEEDDDTELGMCSITLLYFS